MTSPTTTSGTKETKPAGRDFVVDLQKIRKEARHHIENGAVTPTYAADQTVVINLLTSALATEWICVLRYTQHELAARGIHAGTVAAHFAEHAREEQLHAMQLAQRIKQLGGIPCLDPSQMRGLSHSEYREGETLAAMIKENLIAERIAIETYSEAIRFLGDRDPTTRRLLEEILAKEEEHADDMADLLTLDLH